MMRRAWKKLVTIFCPRAARRVRPYEGNPTAHEEPRHGRYHAHGRHAVIQPAPKEEVAAVVPAALANVLLERGGVQVRGRGGRSSNGESQSSDGGSGGGSNGSGGGSSNIGSSGGGIVVATNLAVAVRAANAGTTGGRTAPRRRATPSPISPDAIFEPEERKCTSKAAALVVELPVSEEGLAVEAQAFAFYGNR